MLRTFKAAAIAAASVWAVALLIAAFLSSVPPASQSVDTGRAWALYWAAATVISLLAAVLAAEEA